MMFTTIFTLTGLHCASCTKVSELRIGKIPGVESVRVALRGETGEGTLTASREIAREELQQALAGTPYTVHKA